MTTTHKDERRSEPLVSIGVVTIYIISEIMGGLTEAYLSLISAIIPVISIIRIVVVAKVRIF